jgi:hypothetical protein
MNLKQRKLNSDLLIEESKDMALRKMGSPSLTAAIGTTSSSDSTPRSPVDPASAPVNPIRMWLLNSHGKRQKKKMTQGWVVYGGMRHAEPQREMFPRSYCLGKRQC